MCPDLETVRHDLEAMKQAGRTLCARVTIPIILQNLTCVMSSGC